MNRTKTAHWWLKTLRHRHKTCSPIWQEVSKRTVFMHKITASLAETLERKLFSLAKKISPTFASQKTLLDEVEHLFSLPNKNGVLVIWKPTDHSEKQFVAFKRFIISNYWENPGNYMKAKRNFIQNWTEKRPTAVVNKNTDGLLELLSEKKRQFDNLTKKRCLKLPEYSAEQKLWLWDEQARFSTLNTTEIQNWAQKLHKLSAMWSPFVHWPLVT